MKTALLSSFKNGNDYNEKESLTLTLIQVMPLIPGIHLKALNSTYNTYKWALKIFYYCFSNFIGMPRLVVEGVL